VTVQKNILQWKKRKNLGGNFGNPKKQKSCEQQAARMTRRSVILTDVRIHLIIVERNTILAI